MGRKKQANVQGMKTKDTRKQKLSSDRNMERDILRKEKKRKNVRQGGE
jgi:hypothetical protein